MAGDGKGMMGGGKSAFADIIKTSDEIRSLVSIASRLAHGEMSIYVAQAWLAKNYPGYEDDYLPSRSTKSDQGESPSGS